MTDLEQPRIISYGSEGNTGRYGLKTPPPAAHVSHKPEMVGQRYGWVAIISPEKRWSAGWRGAYVLTRCTGCGKIRWTSLNALTRGKSRGCQRCSQPKRIPRWLEKRLVSAKQRCENPDNPGFRNYGGRGITFDFPSVLEAGLWIMEHATPDREMDIDRIDNSKGYAPGNIRFVTHRENCANRRITVLANWNPDEWPYARSVVVRKLRRGETRETIIADAVKAVREKRKNWKGIASKLASMTS